MTIVLTNEEAHHVVAALDYTASEYEQDADSVYATEEEAKDYRNAAELYGGLAREIASRLEQQR